MPQVPQVSPERVLQEVGSLQVRLNVTEEYVVSLRQVIAELQKQIAELKAKCKDRCEEKK